MRPSIPAMAMIDCSNNDGGGQTFVLLDARHDEAYQRQKTAYILMDPIQYDGLPDHGYKDVSYGAVVHLGRSFYTNCFSYDKDLGSNQVTITGAKDLVDIWGLWRSGDCSTNVVVASGHSDDNNDQGEAKGHRVVRSRGGAERHTDDRKNRVFEVGNKVVEAMVTIKPERNSMGNWLEWNGQWREMKDPVKYPVGAFSDNGRLYPILCRDSKVINGSVGVSKGSEAVLIDGDSPQIRKLTDSAADDVVRLTARRYGERAHSIVDDDEMLTALRGINSDVAMALRYDLAKVDSLCGRYYDRTSGEHKVIKLSEFVRLGFGVCRQQAMLAAIILENLSNRGIIVGSAGVERNYNIRKSDGSMIGGHEWATFTNAVTGTKYVIDPAQGFTGTKEDAYRAYTTNGSRWSYFVDKAEYEKVAARAKHS